MATPLSDNIRALIAYANEKTDAGDTTLGGAVKTLCDGFGGVGNVPSSPFPVPRGPLSSRLAALLTYANETTGAGDTSIGDAVRTLVDGYGAGSKELVFYEKIATDGNAYIDTGILGNGPISTNVTFVWEGGSTFSPDSVILGARVNSGDTRFFPSALNYNKLAIGQGIYSASSEAIGTSLMGGYTITHEATIVSGGSKQRISVPELNYEGENTYTRTVPDTNKNMFLFRVNYQSPYPCSSYLNIKSVLIWNDTTRTNKVLHLVPCTYNGEPGMWDLVNGQFYGNAAGSGAFTVDGRIGKALLFDQLISDGTAYIATDYIPGANFKRLNLDFVGLTQYNDILGTRNFATSNNAFAITVGTLNRTATYSIFSRNNVNYNYGVSAEVGWNVLIEESGANYNASTTRVGGSPSLKTVAKATNYPSNPLYVFGINNGASVTPSNAGTIIRRLEIEDGDIRLDLRPCYYDGQYGMWDTISERFYGNANPAGGTFTAEND